MASILEGWLRVAGEKFYAITRPKAVKLDEGGTLQDILNKFDTEEILTDIEKLQKEFDRIREDFDIIYDLVGVYNIQTGVYTATKDIIADLAVDDRLDDNVMYLVTEDSSLISKVATRVIWKDKEGVTLKSETYTGLVGSTVEIPFYDRLEISGRAYKYTPSGSEIVDRGTGKVTKQVTPPGDDTVTKATLYFTKNVVLELRPI